MAAVVAIPFRRGEIWSWWVLLGGWGSVLVPLFFITLRLGFQSPWWLVLFMGFCVATALALTCERTP